MIKLKSPLSLLDLLADLFHHRTDWSKTCCPPTEIECVLNSASCCQPAGETSEDVPHAMNLMALQNCRFSCRCKALYGTGTCYYK